MSPSTADREGRLANRLAAARKRWDVAWVAGAVLLCLCVLCVGAGIIVYLSRGYRYLDDINTIVLIISHIGILTAGILVGARWMLRQLDDDHAGEAVD
jgi:hypothetical protein